MNLNIDPDWFRQMAEKEDNRIVSVGGAFMSPVTNSNQLKALLASLGFSPQDSNSKTLVNKFIDFLEQIDYKHRDLYLRSKFECYLIEEGSYEQALKLLRQSLTMVQRSALKRVLRNFQPSEEYGHNADGDEVSIQGEVDWDELFEALTKDQQ